MLTNLFTITSSDGKLNETPSGEFASTSTLPSDSRTIIKGTSDFVPVNDGMPGFYSNPDYGRPEFYIEENGEPLLSLMNGNNSAFMGSDPKKIKGTTIYGYIITFGSKNFPYSNSSEQKNCYIINLITNPTYKLDQATYEGWGLTDISWTASNKLWHGYSVEGVVGDTTNRIEYGPILWNYYGGNYPDIRAIVITTTDNVLSLRRLNLGSNSASYQHTQNTKFVELYAPRKITILNTDVIIPSLEDRVSQLEKEVAAIPGATKAALAHAVTEVSKLYTAR